MRNWFVLVVCAMLVLTGAVYAQVTCNPMTPPEKQNRTEMKHRAPAPDTVAAVIQTVPQMIALPVPKITTLVERDQETPLSDQESKVFELTGDLWHVKLAGDDCDFHLELSAPGAGKSADRVIVEIPQGPAFEKARQTLVGALNRIQTKVDKPDVPHDLGSPLRVKVRGFAFLDAWHYSSKDPQRGHAHGTNRVATLWEIHPVWKIVPNP